MNDAPMPDVCWTSGRMGRRVNAEARSGGQGCEFATLNGRRHEDGGALSAIRLKERR